MQLGELLKNIRVYYLDRLLEAADSISPPKEVILEPALLNNTGEIVTEGFFDCGVRVDIVVTEDDVIIESKNIDTEKMLTFSCISFEWGSKLSVELFPFQWNYCAVSVFAEDLQWKPIENWYKKWFRENPNNTSRFMNCVHFISDPKKNGEGYTFEIDFGTSPVETIEEFLDAVEMSGTKKLCLGGD